MAVISTFFTALVSSATAGTVAAGTAAVVSSTAAAGASVAVVSAAAGSVAATTGAYLGAGYAAMGGLAGVGTAVSVGSSILGAVQSQQAANQQAALDANSAAWRRYDAELTRNAELEALGREEESLRKRRLSALGEARVACAASGAVIGTGTCGEIETTIESEFAGAQEELFSASRFVRAQGDVAAETFSIAGQSARARSRSVFQSGLIAGAETGFQFLSS